MGKKTPKHQLPKDRRQPFARVAHDTPELDAAMLRYHRAHAWAHATVGHGGISDAKPDSHKATNAEGGS